MFGIISASVFFALLALFYVIYGYQFLFETYLYHVTRTDHRHNFSPYFLHLYLSSAQEHSKLVSLCLSLATFLPQIVMLIVVWIKFYRKDIIKTCLLSVTIFVAFNKVITVQYFIWYLSLLPIVLCKIDEKQIWPEAKKLGFPNIFWAASYVYFLSFLMILGSLASFSLFS